MSDYRDLDWEMFTGHVFSKAELDEIYQQGRTDLLTEFKEQGAYDIIRADERARLFEKIKSIDAHFFIIDGEFYLKVRDVLEVFEVN